MKTYQVTIPMRCQQTVMVDADSKAEALRLYATDSHSEGHIEILKEFKPTVAIDVTELD